MYVLFLFFETVCWVWTALGKGDSFRYINIWPSYILWAVLVLLGFTNCNLTVYVPLCISTHDSFQKRLFILLHYIKATETTQKHTQLLKPQLSQYYNIACFVFQYCSADYNYISESVWPTTKLKKQYCINSSLHYILYMYRLIL